MVHPYWWQVADLLEIGEGFLWRKLLLFSAPELNKISRAINWGMATKQNFKWWKPEDLLAKVRDQLLLTNQVNAGQVRYRHMINIYRKVTPKKLFCEETFANEFFDKKFSKVSFPAENIGIELEVENWGNDVDDPDENFGSYLLHEDWQITDDASLGDKSAEFVSRAMPVNEALNSFSHLCKYLRKCTDAQGSHTCGLHFHVGLTEEMKKDAQFLSDLEDDILDYLEICIQNNRFYLLQLDQRQHNYYCGLVKTRNAPNGRYCAVNLSAVKKHGTIEIRIAGVSENLSLAWVQQFGWFVQEIYNMIYPKGLEEKYAYKPEGYALEVLAKC